MIWLQLAPKGLALFLAYSLNQVGTAYQVIVKSSQCLTTNLMELQVATLNPELVQGSIEVLTGNSVVGLSCWYWICGEPNFTLLFLKGLTVI